MKTYCANCGTNLLDGVDVCPNCGQPRMMSENQNANNTDEAQSQQNGYNQSPYMRKPRKFEGPLIINEEAKGYMSTFASWSKFVSIFTIVLSSLYLLFILIALVTASSNPAIMRSAYRSSGYPYNGGVEMFYVSMVIALIVLILGIYVNARVCAGANRFQNALRTGDENKVAQGFKDFRFVAVFAGVMCIIAIVLFVLALFAGILAGLN